VAPEDVKLKGRLQPGKMLLVDTPKAASWRPRAQGAALRRNPYQLWLKENQIVLDQLAEPPREHAADAATLQRRQRAFGYTAEI